MALSTVAGSSREAIGDLDSHLASRPYLMGHRLSHADVALWGQIYNACTDPTGASLSNGSAFNMLAWTAPSRLPDAEPVSPRQQSLIGPVFYYEATFHDDYLRGFRRGYIGAAELIGVKAGIDLTVPPVTQPDQSEAEFTAARRSFSS